MATAEEPPPFLFHLCLFNLSPSISNFFMHVLLYPILPFYNCWLSSPPKTLSFTHICFLHKHFTLLFFHMTKTSLQLQISTVALSYNKCFGLSGIKWCNEFVQNWALYVVSYHTKKNKGSIFCIFQLPWKYMKKIESIQPYLLCLR